MVKGVSRQVIVVRPPDTKLFEQAISADGAATAAFPTRRCCARPGRPPESICRQAARPVAAFACKTSPGR